MPTISANVTKRELDAIREYANACGETVSNIIRKSIIRQATFMDGGEEHHEYHLSIMIPESISGNDETMIVQNTHNKIRRILGLNEIII